MFFVQGLGLAHFVSNYYGEIDSHDLLLILW